MLQACDVGHRVVVRRRVDQRLASDLLGTLVAIDGERLVVRTDDGADHAVPAADVIAAKPVPPRPTRYSEIEALERVADACWPAPVREQLGGWTLRAGEGFSNRANSALPLGDAGLGLTDAIDATATWYRAHELTPRITVPLPLRRDVADALSRPSAEKLASPGPRWYPQPTVLVQAAQLAGLAGESSTVLEPAPSAGFLRIVAARKQSLPPSALEILTGVPEVRFAHRYAPDGSLAAIARGAVVAGWLHLSLVEVVESARRQGLAQEITRALAGWASGLGATRAFLQVEARNTAALPLYQRLGFRTHHTYITYAQG